MIRRFLTIRSLRSAARAVDEEVRFHLEMRAEALLRSGACASLEEARARAVNEFGDVAEARRELTEIDEIAARRAERADWWRDLAQDARYALRDYRRHPVFAGVLIATLALGIGANAAIFTLIDAVRLRPLAVSHPEQLVMLGSNSMTGSVGSSSNVFGTIFSFPGYPELRKRTPYLTGLVASGPTGRLDVLPNAAATELEHPNGRFVSARYFEVLGVAPGLGRVFDGSEDETVGASPVVVLSHGYWERRFAGDSSVIGRQLTIDRVPFTIIGVARDGFSGEVVGEAADVWIPLTMQPAMMPAAPRLDDTRFYWLQAFGRVKSGVTVAQAIERSKTVMRQVLEEESRLDPARVRFPPGLVMEAGSAETGFSSVREDFAKPLVTMMVGVGLVLLIVCANVGNLLLARAIARHREMAVRIAIGAGRARLVRQLVTESVVLALVSASVSLVVATGGSRLLLGLASAGGIVTPLDLALDLRIVAFTAAISLSAVLFFGLTPAYRATRVDVAPVLRAQGRGSLTTGGAAGRRIPLMRLLVVGQVALSLVLLAGAALLVRSLESLERLSPGFDRERLVLVDVDDQAVGYTGARHTAFVRELNTRLAALPGVTSASVSMNGLFSGSDWSTEVRVPGFVPRTAKDSSLRYDYIGPGYVRTIGARVIAGRELTDRDVEHTAPVVLVNEAMARYYFGRLDVVGRTLSFTDSTDKPIDAEIVGVVSDIRTGETSWREGAISLTQPPVRRFYMPYFQHAGDTPPSEARFEIRTDGDPTRLLDAVRRAVVSVDDQVPIEALYTLDARIRDSIARERLVAKLAGVFGVVALLLATIGLYGLMMHAVSRRTGELGLRMALGAGRGDIVRMVLGEALRLVGVGLAVGVPAGFAVARLIRSQVPGIGSVDLPSMVVAIGVLVAAAVSAALVPAVRAGRVAPIVALQQE
jgi:predicted permease